MENINHKKIIFDLGAVIIDLKSESDWWKEDLFPNFNQEQLEKLFKEGFFHDFETGKISTTDFVKVMESIKINPDIAVEKAWNGILKTIPKHRIDLLNCLKENNQVYLLSNTNTIHTKTIHESLEFDFGMNIFDTIFDIQFYSQLVGMRKPNTEIYEHVQQTIGDSNSANFIFLDDKPENLIAPKKLGWQTILVDRDISELIA